MDRLKIARKILKMARELVARELVIVPYDGEHLNVDDVQRLIEAGDSNSNIGNKTDKRFPYEVWAIDVGTTFGTSQFGKVEKLIRDIQ